MAQKTLSVKLSLNDKQFQSALKKSTRQLKRFGASMRRTGQTLTRSLTLPLLALGAVSVKAFDEQAKAIAQVEAGLESTGEAAGFTSKQLQKMASELQGKTLFGDEVILKDATSQLLTFTNIAGEQFARTQVAALNLATRFDGDLKSASIQLGKALNDPVANLGALNRAGIQFSDDQKAVIKSLVETNRLADAQNLILKELETQFGGSAEAAAKAGAGGFKQLQNALMDVSEEFGAIIVDGIDPLKDSLEAFTKVLSNTSKETKQSMVFFGTIAAVLGPVLIIFGLLITAFATVKSFILLSLVPAFKMLIKVLANLTPQGRIISGLILAASFIISHFEPLKKTFNDIKDSILGVKDAKEELDKSLDTTIQTSTQSPEDARANMMRAIQAGVIGFKPKTKPSSSSFKRSSIPERIEPIKALKVEIESIPKVLETVDEKFEDTFTKMERMAMMVSNTIRNAFLSTADASEQSSKQMISSAKNAAREEIKTALAVAVGNQMKSIFATVPFPFNLALAAGAGSIVGSLFAKVIPAFAEGGLVTGSTLGLIGEGPGTSMSNPEVIAPLDKLRSMIGTSGGSTEVFGTISGADILLSSDRARKNRNRTRGY